MKLAHNSRVPIVLYIKHLFEYYFQGCLTAAQIQHEPTKTNEPSKQ